MIKVRTVGMPKDAVERLYTEATYEAIASLPSVRATLALEQKGRCCYCEEKLVIRDEYHRTKIEHFHPRSGAFLSSACSTQSGAKNPEKARVSWANLLLSCDGGRHLDMSTCDDAKQNTDICSIFHNVKNSDSADSLVFIQQTGRAVPRACLDPPNGQQVIDSVLRLNEPHLVRTRRVRMAALVKRYNELRSQHHGLSGARKAGFVTSLRSEATTTEFASVYLSFAERLEQK